MEPLSTPPSSVSGRNSPVLSICISTLNRAEFLRATLDRIIPQLTEQCELLIVDNASKDNTPHVVSELTRQCSLIRYIRKDTNNGADRNFDRAVELARGDYCWLTSDDDLFKPDAIVTVLQALRTEPSAVLVNYEFRDFTMSRVVQERVIDFYTDRIYGAWEADRMFVELQDAVRYIGALVIKRTIWLSRRRDLYFGSSYAFVGMIYQERFPRHVHVIAAPCVSYRIGSDSSLPLDSGVLEIMLCKWPSLVASLPLAESTKRTLQSARPWRHPYLMLFWRATGYYSFEQYRRWMRPQLGLFRDRLVPIACAALPRTLANFLLTIFLSMRRSRLRQLLGLHLEVLETSPFYLFGLRRREQRKLQEATSLAAPENT
jgi:abequosyltransferase